MASASVRGRQVARKVAAASADEAADLDPAALAARVATLERALDAVLEILQDSLYSRCGSGYAYDAYEDLEAVAPSLAARAAFHRAQRAKENPSG